VGHDKPSFLSGLLSMALGRKSELSSMRHGAAQLEGDIRMLEGVHRQFFLEINDVHKEHVRQQKAQTFIGRIFNLLGYFFSGYCVYKVVMASINIVFQRVRKTDPISHGFELFFKYVFRLELDVRLWSQYISFFFIGVLVATQMRGFLILFVRIFHRYASGLNSNSIVLLLTEIMGMYFVSSVLLMRMNLPIEYRQIVTKVLGDIEFHFYYHWFDLIFVVSATVSFVVLFLSRQSASQLKEL
jgi:hypothetical protein